MGVINYNKSFLVTGGTGFIGSSLVRRLLETGARVRSLDNDSRGSKERLADVAADVEFFTGDIRDADLVRRAISGVDCVCHLACINGTEFFYSHPDLVLDVAIKGMINVIDGCIHNRVPELILASSSEVYQSQPRIPTDESVPLIIPDPLNSRYSYGAGKIISELLAINFGRKYFERVIIFRPHNVYGPNMGWEHVIPHLGMRLIELCRQSEGKLSLPIQGSGEETRAFIYIDDMIDGLLRIIEQGEHLNIYHIGCPNETTIRELAVAMGRYFGREVEVIPGPLQAGGPLRRCPDVSKLRKLGFAPEIQLEDGLARTLRWYESNAHHQPKQRQPRSGTDAGR